MPVQQITDVLSKPTATADSHSQIANLANLANDLSRYTPPFRFTPAGGVGTRYSGLYTALIKDRLLQSQEVKSALQANDSNQPLALRLSHPNKLSLITASGENEIKLPVASQILAGELLNRLYMPKGISMMVVRADWAFRTVLLPIPERSPTA